MNSNKYIQRAADVIEICSASPKEAESIMGCVLQNLNKQTFV